MVINGHEVHAARVDKFLRFYKLKEETLNHQIFTAMHLCIAATKPSGLTPSPACINVAS